MNKKEIKDAIHEEISKIVLVGVAFLFLGLMFWLTHEDGKITQRSHDSNCVYLNSERVGIDKCIWEIK